MLTERVQRPSLGSTRVLIARRECEEALLELSLIVRENPFWAEPWVLVGQALSMKARYLDALTAVEHALVIDPMHVWAQELRTGLLLQLDQHRDAVMAAERLVDISPDRAESYAFLAFAEAFAGRDRSALAAARKCQKLSAGKSVGHQALCVVHLASNRWAHAERHALAAIAAGGPLASLYHDLGVAQFEQGRIEDARNSFAKAVTLDKRFAGPSRKVLGRDRVSPSVIPIAIALIAGLAAVPFGTMPVAFVAVVTIGIAALIVATRGRDKILSRKPLQLALGCVLCFDFAVALSVLGFF